MPNDKNLSYLYEEIHQCHICPNMDREKVMRRLDATDLKTDVFIISQSLAENQLRKTGVNFFADDGALGSTGINLEKFLNLIGRTVYPPKDVILESGAKIEGRKETNISVYNSEITQCFPGKMKDGKGDRKPSAEEIHNCLTQEFLSREIQILKPKIVILMGRISRNIFFRFVVRNTIFPKSLAEHIAQIVGEGKIPEFLLGDHQCHLLPIQHASGANPYFSEMLLNQKLAEMIRKELR
jgi:uracil-DNA glycosylase